MSANRENRLETGGFKILTHRSTSASEASLEELRGASISGAYHPMRMSNRMSRTPFAATPESYGQ